MSLMRIRQTVVVSRRFGNARRTTAADSVMASRINLAWTDDGRWWIIVRCGLVVRGKGRWQKFAGREDGRRLVAAGGLDSGGKVSGR